MDLQVHRGIGAFDYERCWTCIGDIRDANSWPDLAGGTLRSGIYIDTVEQIATNALCCDLLVQ